MSTYVLVHGGGHGGWCYQPLARRLRAAGHEVYTPTLTGLGERAHLLHPGVDLELQIQDVTSVIETEDLQDVVLVGHSFGGMVITGAADRVRGRVRRMVYLDAAHPRGGMSLEDYAPTEMAMLKYGLRVVNDVELVLWPDIIGPQFYGIKDAALIAWMAPRLKPHPWKCFTQKLDIDDSYVRSIPRTNINCVESLQRSSPEARATQTDGEHNWELDTGHDLMLTEPDEVARLLLRVA